jgi:hypothetical protein
MERLISQRTGGELSTWGRFGCAAVAGTVSALVASPTELIIIQQQVGRHDIDICSKHLNDFI